MRIRLLLAFSGFGLLACSTAAPQTSETVGGSTSSASNSDGTGDPPGQTSVVSAASTDAPTTGVDTLTGSGTATQGTTADPTSPGTTSETGTGGPGTTSETTDSGTTDSGTTDSGTTDSGCTSEGTTGGLGGGACEVDADCKLHDDACSCYAIPVGQEDPVCDAQCDPSQCEQIGIDEAVCVLGQCVTEQVYCGLEAPCGAPPPECPPGTLPGLDELRSCWTGACVPVISCSSVPACDLCPDSFICVDYPSVFGPWWVCRPRPAACDGEVDCECAGDVCNDGIEVCEEGVGDADLVCHCPDC